MGVIVFEPMIILTNVLLFLCGLHYFRQLSKFEHKYSKEKAVFLLLIGVSAIFGSVAHAVHFQLGDLFFKTVLFLMNAISLLAILFFFRGSISYLSGINEQKRMIVFGAGIWVLLLLMVTLYFNEFILIKLHAGLVLVYSLVIHYVSYKRNDSGSKYILLGILLSFFSILVHSLRFSLHEWFNYKDISHVIMLISMHFIYRGIKLNSEELEAKSLVAEQL